MKTYLLLRRVTGLITRWAVANPWAAIGIYLAGQALRTVLRRRRAEKLAVFPLVNNMLDHAVGLALAPLAAGATIGALGQIIGVLEEIVPARKPVEIQAWMGVPGVSWGIARWLMGSL